jgi:CubicO group peptidase (beta-lactamase class C family)
MVNQPHRCLRHRLLYVSLRTAVVAAGVCLLWPAGALSAADAPPRGDELPATPAGKLAGELIQAINGGDPRAQREFIRRRFVESRQQPEVVEEHLTLMRKMYEQGGGVEARRVNARGPLELSLVARSKRGGHWVRLFLRANDKQPERMDGFGAVPARDPDAGAPAWPSGRLDEAAVAAAIEAHVRRRAEEDRFSGVVLVARGPEGRVLLHRACGLADRDFAVPNGPRTKFHLGSMNKMFTAVCVARLVEAGKLSFDDPLVKVLPDYPNPEAARKITVRHLLTHTAGLGSLFDRPGFDVRKRYRSHADYFPVFAREPLAFEPGTAAEYSNEGFIVLGAVLEKLTGQDYLEHVREVILRPLGMADTDSYAVDEVVPGRAVGYARYEDDPFGIEPRHPNWMKVGWRGNACGGGYSTAPDLLRFAVALRDGRLVGRATADALTAPQGKLRDYGMGFQSRPVNGKSVRGHNGGGPNYGINSDLEIFWDGSYTVVVLGNYDAPAAQELNREIVEFLSRQ